MINRLIKLVNENEHKAEEVIREIVEKYSTNQAKIYITEIIGSLEKNISKAWGFLFLSKLYHDIGDYEEANRIIKEAESIFQKENHIRGLILAYNGQMANYCNSERFDLGIEYVLKAEALAEEYADVELLGKIKGNKVALYMEMNEYVKALEVLEQIEKFSFTKNTEIKVANMFNKGICEVKVERIDEGLQSILAAYEISKSADLKMISAIIFELGKIYKLKGMYEEAILKFQDSIDYGYQKGFIMYIREVLNEWAEIEFLRGNYEEATSKIRDVLADEKSTNSEKYNAYKLNEKIALKIGDYKRAYESVNKQLELQNKMDKENYQKELQALNENKVEQEAKVYKLLYSQAESLYKFGQRITANLDKKDIFDLVVEEMRAILPLNSVQIAVYNDENKIMNHELCMEGNSHIDLSPYSIDEDTFGNYCFKEKSDVFINDFAKEAKNYIQKDMYTVAEKSSVKKSPQSLMFVPLLVNDLCIGFFSIQHYEKNMYTLKDLNTMKIIATYISIAMENAKLYREVEYGAMYDGLTKIFNRKEVFKRAKVMEEGNLTLAVMMIDVDYFKKINDNYGHQTGDYVLQKVAESLKNVLRKSDLIGRYGGEEFIVVFPLDEEIKVKTVAERILESIRQTEIITKEHKLFVTASVGVSVGTKGEMLEKIISRADKALYNAKELGRNRIIYI